MKLLTSVFAVLFIVLGIVSLATPIPGAVLFIAGGITMLVCSNQRARFCIRWIRTRINWVNKVFFWLERKIGGRVNVIGKALSLTHPTATDYGSSTIGHQEFLKEAMKSEIKKQ